MITSFKELIAIESQKEYNQALKVSVIQEYNQYTCYPAYENIYRALSLTPL